MAYSDRHIFFTLFFAIFSTVTGVGIVVPLLPVYARSMGASGFMVGMIFGAFSLSRSFFLPVFGRLSDKKGRKPMIVPGMLAYSLVSIAFVIFQDVISVLIIRFLQGIASAMLLPVIQAYIGDITPRGKEGTTMGLFNMSLFIGLSIGPVLGGVIRDWFGLQAAFISMGVLSFVGFLLTLFLLPPRNTEIIIHRARPPARWGQIIRDPEIAGLFAYRFAYTAGIGIIWGFLPVLADVDLSLSSSATGFLLMLGIFVSGLIHLPMGYLADRIDRKRMVAVGGFIAAIAVAVFYWSGSFRDMLLASLFFGIGGGISMPALMAMAVLKGDRSAAMGSVMSILTVAHSLGMLTGAMLAGLMMDVFELRLAFPVGATLMLAGVGLFYFSFKNDN
jgi:MFS family permease